MTRASRRRRRLADRTAAVVIRLGGVLVVAMVCLIVVDIARQALPLFTPARVGEALVVSFPERVVASGCSSRDGRTSWAVTADGLLSSSQAPEDATRVVDRGTRLVAAHVDHSSMLCVLTDRSQVHCGEVVSGPKPEWTPVATPLTLDGGDWTAVTAARSARGDLLVLAWGDGPLMVARWLADGSEWHEVPLGSIGPIAAAGIACSLRRIAVVTGSGELVTLALDGEQVIDRCRPLPSAAVRLVAFLASGDSLVAALDNGSTAVLVAVPTVRISNRRPAPVRLGEQSFAPGASAVVFASEQLVTRAEDTGLEVTSAFSRLRRVRSAGTVDGSPTALATFPNGRSFMVGTSSGRVGLFHATSGRRLHHTKWSDAVIESLGVSARGETAVAVSASQLIQRTVVNPHPEVSWRTLFLPVWYEGYSGPAIVWQSTGGSESFEPKLSLTPLILGTVKAAAYALVLALPLALLAAVYVAQLAPPWLAQLIKPAFELMAAVPSVVIGFVAAIWLAPILEQRLLLLLLLLGSWPLAALMAVIGWRAIPVRWRRRLPRGSELIVLLFAVGGLAVVLVGVAPRLEDLLFAGDLPRYLFTELGLRYDQRNALLAGIALAFAVIPVIFTIAEDACSAVPSAQINAARALGATRWQTTLHLVLPAAAPGLVAAVVLGLGRALGETMIVLMATGNTPILDLSPFNGMRTLSAAIAVEIPEAPVGGTLFRVLFLAGFVLFLLTLAVTTIADLVSESVRRRHGTP